MGFGIYFSFDFNTLTKSFKKSMVPIEARNAPSLCSMFIFCWLLHYFFVFPFSLNDWKSQWNYVEFNMLTLKLYPFVFGKLFIQQSAYCIQYLKCAFFYAHFFLNDFSKCFILLWYESALSVHFYFEWVSLKTTYLLQQRCGYKVHKLEINNKKCIAVEFVGFHLTAMWQQL